MVHGLDGVAGRAGRTGWHRMRRSSWLLVALLCACVPVDTGSPTPPTDTSRPASTGYVAVVFINHSSQLVQDVISVEHRNLQPEVWVTPVTPKSWDALLIDYPVQRITVIGVTPVDLQTGQAGEQIPYADGAYVDRDRITCGSVIVVRTRDAGDDSGEMIVEVDTLPDSDGSDFVLADRSARSPGADSSLVVIRPEVPTGVSAQARFTWENGNGQVFSSNWHVSGIGAGTAALVECPLKRVGWGNLRDPSLPGATLDNPAIDLAAPLALRAATTAGQTGGFACGDTIRLQLLQDDTADNGYRLDAESSSEDAIVPAGTIDLFGNIRSVLDQEGMAGRLSNTGLLLPAAPGEED